MFVNNVKNILSKIIEPFQPKTIFTGKKIVGITEQFLVVYEI